jgi:hydrogenase maturation protease
MSVALIGSGNAFFKDEGVGLYAAKYLKENYTFEPELHIVDGGTLGFGMMPLLQEFNSVVIANTSSSDDKPIGTIEVISDEQLIAMTGSKKTANEVEIAEMLQICSMADKVAKTMIVSIVPEDIIAVEVGLTPIVKERWMRYIETILSEIEKCGITCNVKKGGMNLDEILETFANPSHEQGRYF